MSEITVDAQGRPVAPRNGDEAETLVGFLEWLRATIEWKTAGLSDEQLRVPLAPSAMTLGGMLKHLAFVEDHWFGHTIARADRMEPFGTADWEADEDFEWNSAAADSGSDLRTLWGEAVARSRKLTARLLDLQPAALDAQHGEGNHRASLRWILTHMIEEYARHAGHVDLLRENLDGLTGD